MGLKVGNVYRTEKDRGFKIIGKKEKKSSFPYIGECTKTGFVTYFAYNGEHWNDNNYSLNTDLHLYLPVFQDGSVDTRGFIKKSKIGDGLHMGYIRAINGNIKNVEFIGRNIIDD